MAVEYDDAAVALAVVEQLLPPLGDEPLHEDDAR
jgi:hypothetical protein